LLGNPHVLRFCLKDLESSSSPWFDFGLIFSLNELSALKVSKIELAVSSLAQRRHQRFETQISTKCNIFKNILGCESVA
jgi:hypothetical protein